jgi:hypothetical protein
MFSTSNWHQKFDVTGLNFSPGETNNKCHVLGQPLVPCRLQQACRSRDVIAANSDPHYPEEITFFFSTFSLLFNFSPILNE